MNKTKVNIWGRDFELYVSYQNFPDEDITSNQVAIYESLPFVDFSDSLSYVKQFVMKRDGYKINENGISNIFKYVMPKSILITRDNNIQVFAVMCNYKFDMEHGLAIIFENKSFKNVGSQDLIL